MNYIALYEKSLRNKNDKIAKNAQIGAFLSFSARMHLICEKPHTIISKCYNRYKTQRGKLLYMAANNHIFHILAQNSQHI